MRQHLSLALIVTFALLAFTSNSFAQCTPTCPDPCACDPNPPPGGCYVYSAQQLQDALAGTSTCSGCTGGVPAHIIIPAGVVICRNSTINLGSPQHDNLRLTIDGELVWTGAANCQQALINVSGSGITIDGAGLLTSTYVPCGGVQDPNLPNHCLNHICDPESDDLPPGGWASNARPYIAWGIEVDGATSLTVTGISSTQPLRFSNLSSMVQASSGGDNVTLRHLDGTELARYGVFAAGDTWTLDDCHIHGGTGGVTSYNEHGFRSYAHNITIRDCSAHDIQSGKSGFWLVAGNYGSAGGQFLVDGFITDQHCWLGPNHTDDWTCNPSTGVPEPALVNGTIRNVKSKFGGFGDLPKRLDFHMGSRNINVITLVTAHPTSIDIARGANCYPLFGCPDSCVACPLNRPLNNIYWANISGDVTVNTMH